MDTPDKNMYFFTVAVHKAVLTSMAISILNLSNSLS